MGRQLWRMISTPDGLEATINLVIHEIDAGKTNPELLALAHDIVRELPDRGTLKPADQDHVELYAIWLWVVKNIRYTRDINHVELTRDVEAILLDRQGDCDDHVILVGSLVGAIGLPYEIWLSGIDSPSHIYGVSYTSEGRPLAVDTASKTVVFGEPPGHPHHWRVQHGNSASPNPSTSGRTRR